LKILFFRNFRFIERGHWLPGS